MSPGPHERTINVSLNKKIEANNSNDLAQSLTCSSYFLSAGMYGLAAHEEKDENSDRWMGIAAGITNTCHESYDRSDTKLGPEAFRFTDAVEARAVKQNERYYILR